MFLEKQAKPKLDVMKKSFLRRESKPKTERYVFEKFLKKISFS